MIVKVYIDIFPCRTKSGLYCREFKRHHNKVSLLFLLSFIFKRQSCIIVSLRWYRSRFENVNRMYLNRTNVTNYCMNLLTDKAYIIYFDSKRKRNLSLSSTLVLKLQHFLASFWRMGITWMATRNGAKPMVFIWTFCSSYGMSKRRIQTWTYCNTLWSSIWSNMNEVLIKPRMNLDYQVLYLWPVQLRWICYNISYSQSRFSLRLYCNTAVVCPHHWLFTLSEDFAFKKL